MTGEMWSITQAGEDDSGDWWPVHAAIAKALGGRLMPFDQYQGPYIAVKGRKLWISSPDGEIGQVWEETTRLSSGEFLIVEAEEDAGEAIEAAKVLMKAIGPKKLRRPGKRSRKARSKSRKR